MSKSLFLCGTAFLFVAFSPLVLHAQFQQPTADELKMTADPKAPGADAVYLNLEEITNDPLHVESYSARIKVLTEKGKELATVQIPYWKGSKKVTDIKGRTIHPDGTVIPLDVKPEDLLSEKNGDSQSGRVVFTLPSVEVGSILEYSYQLRYDDNHFSSPLWQIQRPQFIHAAHYSFSPFKAFAPQGTAGTETNSYLIDEHGRPVNSLIWWSHLPPDVTIKTSVNGSYNVDVTDVPPIPHEEWMPPINDILYKVLFYYKNAGNAQEFWMNESKFWTKDVDKFAEPTAGIKGVVSGLIAPSDSDLDKAKKLYAAVQALDNTDYSRQKGASEMKQLKIKAAKRAEDTWTQKSGSSEDIAMLYLAMLRAAGLTAYPVKVVDRDDGVFDPSYMSFSQLDTTIVVTSAGGQQIALDPGEKMCPFGTVNWRHSGVRGIGESKDGISIVTTPGLIYKDNSTTRSGDLTIDAHGGVTGRFAITMGGQEALRWRQAALRLDKDELYKQYDRDLEGLVPDGIEAHIDHFVSIDRPEDNLLALVNVRGTLGTATSKRLLLPGFFFETRVHQPFVNEDKREVPVDMRYGERVSDNVTYHLPAGMMVEGAPQDANVAWAGHAVLVAKTSATPGQIIIADSLARAFDEVKPEDYQALRGFYQKVDATDQGQLVLTLSATADAAPAAAAGKAN